MRVCRGVGKTLFKVSLFGSKVSFWKSKSFYLNLLFVCSSSSSKFVFVVGGAVSTLLSCKKGKIKATRSK